MSVVDDSPRFSLALPFFVCVAFGRCAVNTRGLAGLWQGSMCAPGDVVVCLSFLGLSGFMLGALTTVPLLEECTNLKISSPAIDDQERERVRPKVGARKFAHGTSN